MRKGPRGTFARLALCCTAAAALTGCGGPARDGYAAVGAAAPGPERGAGDNVAPRGEVEFQPLSAPSAAAGPSTSSGPSASAPGSGPSAGPTGGRALPTAAGDPTTAPGTPLGPGHPSTAGGTPGAAPGTGPAPGTTKPGGGTSPSTPATPSPEPSTPPGAPATPAKLILSPPARAAASDRWCERVTVTFTNSGTTTARSGTVTFATHIIGALGIDWATITTTQPLPAPIAGGTAKTQTYTVCVETWRVPLGMRVETQKVTATWA